VNIRSVTTTPYARAMAAEVLSASVLKAVCRLWTRHVVQMGSHILMNVSFELLHVGDKSSYQLPAPDHVTCVRMSRVGTAPGVSQEGVFVLHNTAPVQSNQYVPAMVKRTAAIVTCSVQPANSDWTSM